MVTNELGACEWFVWDLRRSGLIERGHLDEVVGDYLKRFPRAEPPALAEYLVEKSVLTFFQAERILQGKTQGLVLGPYVLVDTVGAGSMGQVYKAQSKTDSQWYAVKVLPRRSMWNVRLARRQVRAFSQFTNPAVVPFLDVGTSGGMHYLVWPFVEGETLEARVARTGRLSIEETAQMMTQVAQGLAVAHAQGMFHGLLKPSNILLGSDGQARILDFGIGCLLAENEGESLVDTMSTANTLTSGLDCSSPESIMEPTNRTQAGDQYSFGCVLYYCLTGRYPFADGTAVEKMMAHQFKQPTPIRELVAGVPNEMVNILEKLMQKAPDSRYASIDDVVEALLPFTNDGFRRDAGSSFSGGSYSGGSRLGNSRYGSPTPSVPFAAAASQVQVQTPVSGPLTPAPMPAVKQEPVRTAVPVYKPSSPTRASVKESPTPTRQPAVAMATAAPHADVRNLPVAQPVEEPEPRRASQQLPTRASTRSDEPKKGGLSLTLIVLIGALVTVGVYVLGKTFNFVG
jgi:serine/threonine-protein kinase